MQYEVTVTATIVKTYTVEATSEEQAKEKAQETFNPDHDGVYEEYDQEVLNVEQTGV